MSVEIRNSNERAAELEKKLRETLCSLEEANEVHSELVENINLLQENYTTLQMISKENEIKHIGIITNGSHKYSSLSQSLKEMETLNGNNILKLENSQLQITALKENLISAQQELSQMSLVRSALANDLYFRQAHCVLRLLSPMNKVFLSVFPQAPLLFH